MTHTEPFDLHAGFLAKQQALLHQLRLTAEFLDHPTTLGDSSEANWAGMLEVFLPRRYSVGPIFAVDATNRRSQQIDIAIYDNQYSPLWFETAAGVRVVPAESVYAAFEVKPNINKSLADYSADKIASVRQLHRTSVEITDARGTAAPVQPDERPILGGILAVRSDWSEISGEAAVKALSGQQGDQRIDIGIALDALSFDIDYTRDPAEISFSTKETVLIYFCVRLFKRLQRTGTALALDIDAYADKMRPHAANVSNPAK